MAASVPPSGASISVGPWLAHQVVWFPDQPMSHDDLERFTRSLGDWGVDPYVAPLADHPHILEIRREPDEPVAPFGSAWHSDWSFQPEPPSATILHAKIVPPAGGDTWFADGAAAYEALSADERSEVDTLTALHSARRPYSHEGYRAGRGDERSMRILPSDRAWDVQPHPLVRMWDNRSVQHCARGGYDGHRRVMHRTTVAGDRPR